ncbi:MAG: hypothetical protein IKA51_04655 [Clostridia bacterium]|nr:hypothetical protein [Clostridia bacterium]
MFLFKKGLIEGMAFGMMAGIAVGWMIKPSVIKIKKIVSKKMPEMKKESEKFINEMSSDVKELSKDIGTAFCEENCCNNTKEDLC